MFKVKPKTININSELLKTIDTVAIRGAVLLFRCLIKLHPKKNKISLKQQFKLKDIEAEILLLKYDVSSLETYIVEITKKRDSNTGDSLPRVYDKTIEKTAMVLNKEKKVLRDFFCKYGEKPYTQYVLNVIEDME
jgi:hypothetical protein